ncbi:MAG: MFS transporter [Clostridia bacterium]|nr:MFS transporter [Clostridia bacterium]
MLKKLKSMNRNFILFLWVVIFVGISQSVDGSTFNVFLKEQFQMDVLHRTVLEIPRELPGFLVVIVIGFLYVVGDVRIAAIANLLAAFGMFALGIIPANFALMLVSVFVYSMGMHLFMPLTNSIGMSFADDKNLGKRLGQISAANTAALVFGTALLWFLYRFFQISFTVAFTIGAISFGIGSVLLLMMNKNQTVKVDKKFVFKKEYRLFYVMSILWGARKQIFLTFAPWILLDIYKMKAADMTLLFLIISVLGIFMKPLIGALIDRMGERFVLSLEAALLFVLCIGYAFALDLFPFRIALVIVAFCYILDQVSSAANIARVTYLKKIAVKPEDVSPSLSLSTSIDHIPSMFLPSLGGLIWSMDMQNGYKIVFIGGAVIAFLNFLTVRSIKINKPQ